MRRQIGFLFLLFLLLNGCTSVKVAIHDPTSRKKYEEAAKEAYLKTPEGKAFTLRESVLEEARSLKGTPYKYASTDPKKGLDCSGLVYVTTSRNGVTVPRSSKLMADAAPHFPWKKAQPGDFVFFGDRGRIHHVGLVESVGDNSLIVIHSTNQLGVISENVLESTYWKKRILFATSLTAYE